MIFDEFNSRIGLSAKAANANDNLFMAQLFYSTKPFFYGLGLPREVVDTMLAQQYQLQQASYREQYPNANTYILFYQQQTIGKVMLDISEYRIHLIDFIIIPSMQGRGFGSAILAAIKQEAMKRHLPVGLSVESENTQAKKLYLQHGFKLESYSGAYESMLWR
ncbi:GNAT family N-acetyltransferase [Shewanella vaxholmensis]|uniref:GNAT family N-acetyltransferase n=1 Tax=Shewanella vaxholmensis TaxID=3063535 RepID=A0ABU9UPR3_9GAMM|nr:GNAT family N-acetyltransferase [Shewanella sp. SP1S1-4]MDT3307456.1 GNAT family N-acetyltransferase [Shewanella sp. SP1S1-4]